MWSQFAFLSIFPMSTLSGSLRFEMITKAEMHIPPSGIFLILGGTAFLLNAANLLSVTMPSRPRKSLKVLYGFFSR